MIEIIFKIALGWTAASLILGVTFARMFLWAARHPMEEHE
jgi:hypothetical protein